MTKPARKIVIEKGVALPDGRQGKLQQLREALRAMQRGDSFLWESCKAPFDAAKQLKIKIATRKVNGEGCRVWKL